MRDNQYLLNKFKKKNLKDYGKKMKVNTTIYLTAKSLGSGYHVEFKKTKKGFEITDCSHDKSLEGVVYKSLKRLIKELPKPRSIPKEDLSWMD